MVSGRYMNLLVLGNDSIATQSCVSQNSLHTSIPNPSNMCLVCKQCSESLGRKSTSNQLGDLNKSHPMEQREVQSLSLWASFGSQQIPGVHCLGGGAVQLFVRALSAVTFLGLGREVISVLQLLTLTSHLENALMFVSVPLTKARNQICLLSSGI